MNNSYKGRNSKEITIQLKRAKVQKDILIKNIYKKYEIYFKIVREILLSSAEKGIYGLYSDLSVSDKVLDSRELKNFLKKDISALIHSKLPLLTIEQLKIRDISVSQQQLLNVNALKELEEFNEYQTVNFDYEKKLITKESLEFNCNDNFNKYEYYKNLSKDEFSSINLDESVNLNSSKQNINEKIEYEKNILNSLIDLIEETQDNKLNEYENINDKGNDVYISNANLDFFEFIDKSFSNFLLNLSYKINSESFKINLIKNIISEPTFYSLSSNTYIITHPHPFVIRYDLDPNRLSKNNNINPNISLFNITSVELEFYNLDLANCRNNINELKNRFMLLNKKQKYWKHKQLSINSLN